MSTPLVPLLGTLDAQRFGDGSRPLPHRRLERLCKLTAEEEYAIPAVARALRVSPRTIRRARTHPVIRARLAHLRHQVAERAAEDSPLSKRGNRIAMLDDLARTLRQHLIDNEYKAVIAVTKQGLPIEGFDRGRVAELVKTIVAIHDMTTDKPSAQPQQVAMAVTMTTADVVTRVQALLSRTSEQHEGGGHPPGVPGGMSDRESLRNEGGGSPYGTPQISDA